jgi:hypothetical protein
MVCGQLLIYMLLADMCCPFSMPMSPWTSNILPTLGVISYTPLPILHAHGPMDIVNIVIIVPLLPNPFWTQDFAVVSFTSHVCSLTHVL